MIYNLKNEYQLQKYDARVKKLRDKRALVEVTEKNLLRTMSQNNYLHLIIGYFGCEYGCSMDMAKIEFYKKKCNLDLYLIKKLNKRGEEIEDLRHSYELTTSEMSLSIDRFRNWSASEAGIYLPAPNEEQFLIHAMQEIERNKEFL